MTKLEPVVAKPHSPDNKAFVVEVKGTKLDRAYIGSLHRRQADRLPGRGRDPKGKAVKIDTFVVPATTEVARGAEHRDDRRQDRCGTSSWRPARRSATPSCAACLGGPSDTFGRLNTPISLHQHDQPQLPRPHGAQGGEGLPGQPADRGRQRADRHDRGLPGALGLMRMNRRNRCPS